MKLIASVLVVSLAVALARVVPVSLYGPESERIEGEYVVKFFRGARQQFEAFKAKRLAAPMTIHEFGDYMGFAAKLTPEQLQAVQTMEGVELIEPNIQMHALGEQTNVQAYGIDRSDQRALPLNNIYRWRDNADGSGVRVFILDTGVDTRHPEFEGRARFEADCTGFFGCSTASDPGDPQGHGTHCAGTAVSRLYGIAKNSTVHNVRCLDANGSGSINGIINAVEFTVNIGGGPRIISMSLGGGFSSALNNAVDAAHRAGVVNVVAAGNSNSNACNASPASAPLALTVAASDRNDRKASFSSFGSCVDIWAPGVSILSTTPNGNSALFSGTSMACPHVAGAAALVHSRGARTADQVVADIIAESTPNVIGGNPAGTPNRLLFTSPQ